MDISIHSSHTGRNAVSIRYSPRLVTFQSTLPIREETSGRYTPGRCRPNFNPLFPYGKRLWCIRRIWQVVQISIHSSHTGRDAFGTPSTAISTLFQSTLPIREETNTGNGGGSVYIFQSTLPIREETGGPLASFVTADNFNPLFPYGKRPPWTALPPCC